MRKIIVNRRLAYSRMARLLLIQDTSVYLCCIYVIWCMGNVFITVLPVFMLK